MTLQFDFKLVVAGAFAVGKTTLISKIADADVVGTEAPTSGSEAEVKETTTVGMEYGTFHAGGEGFAVDLNVYGVPGQERFSFMWKIVAVGMDGLLLLVDVTRPDTWEDAVNVADTLRAERDLPVLVAINRFDEVDDALDRIRAAIPIEGAEYLPCDPTDGESARNAIGELLMLVLEAMPDEVLDDDVPVADGQETVPALAAD